MMMSLVNIDAAEHDAETKLLTTLRALNIARLSRADFHRILLQRKEISYEFTGIYDAILSLLTKRAHSGVQAIRRIIREEYLDTSALPMGDMPSHREDLKSDLISLGISEQEFTQSDATASTLTSMLTLREAIKQLKRSAFPDISLLAFLRFWGEVLTAVEYRHFWHSRIESELVGRPSIFYWSHIVHDERKVKLSEAGSDTKNNTHSDELAAALVELFPSRGEERTEALHCVEYAIRIAVKHKVDFYSQFRPMDSPPRIARGMV
ncbi:MAG: hypothetical protein E8D40_00745 [Nitrospira sp.]|nr:MAG: hypothetical protein E8D40_00745 [Nitrospira sp.]